MGASDLTNMPERLLWCQRCRRDVLSKEADAQCDLCHLPLLTVVYSELTGERITGRPLLPADLGLPPRLFIGGL